ncbi:GNAT family N-acetyltransferase [Longimicrobium sp.]|jgi:RimJ/RimL family protein N-acetyltransferase|uniref:GNAT family N-acetyltransferase n=1 Tax=Longimicrobium sp. TaxID=2029185 RepID=UPI002ED8EF30
MDVPPLHPPAPDPDPAFTPATLHDRDGRVFTVRAYTPEDRPALDRFYEAFHPKRAAQGLPPEGAARVARWLDAILPTGTHLVVESEGQLAGHAMLMPTRDDDVREYAIFLDHGVRGRGVGTQVNRFSAEVARTMDVRRLWLSVEPHNRPAVRSYQKAGFRFRAPTLYSPEVEMELDLG